MEQSLQAFKKDFPVFEFVGTQKLIDAKLPYDTDSGVQLVCKYLKKLDNRQIDVLVKGMFKV